MRAAGIPVGLLASPTPTPPEPAEPQHTHSLAGSRLTLSEHTHKQREGGEEGGIEIERGRHVQRADDSFKLELLLGSSLMTGSEAPPPSYTTLHTPLHPPPYPPYLNYHSHSR